jgi:hypothetical protein
MIASAFNQPLGDILKPRVRVRWHVASDDYCPM